RWRDGVACVVQPREQALDEPASRLADTDCGTDRCGPMTFASVSCSEDADCVSEGHLRCMTSRTCAACASNADCVDVMPSPPRLTPRARTRACRCPAASCG